MLGERAVRYVFVMSPLVSVPCGIREDRNSTVWSSRCLPFTVAINASRVLCGFALAILANSAVQGGRCHRSPFVCDPLYA